MRDKGKKALENLAFYSIGYKKDMKKGLDRTFLHYGIRQEDMDIIEDAARSADIDPDWMKEYILKPYNEARNDGNVDRDRMGANGVSVDDKKLRKILNPNFKLICNDNYV